MDADQRGDKITDKQHAELNKRAIEYRQEANEKLINKLYKDGI
jgi:hypothetical protein